MTDIIERLRKSPCRLHRDAEAEITRLRAVRLAAQPVSDAMHLAAGGDHYVFRGSTNDIDLLRDALDRHFQAAFTSPNAAGEKI